MKNYKNIERNPHKLFGRPSVKNRRLSIFNVVSGVYLDNLVEYSETFEISYETIRDCVLYCKDTLCNSGGEQVPYCEGCILDTLSAGTQNDVDSYMEYKVGDNKYYSMDDKGNIYLGSKEEMREDDFGRPGWSMAEEIFRKYFSTEQPHLMEEDIPFTKDKKWWEFWK